MAEAAYNQEPSQEDQAEQQVMQQIIESKYGIKTGMLQILEGMYPGITEAGMYQSKQPTQYENALKELLLKIKAELKVKEKMMPYEEPKIPMGIPLKVVRLIYPNIDLSLVSEDPETAFNKEVKAIAKTMQKKVEATEGLTKFFDEEARRLDEKPSEDRKAAE